jgi:hypothetical protein
MAQELGTSRRGFLRTGGGFLLGGVLAQLARASEESVPSPPSPAPNNLPVIDCHAHAGIARLAGRDIDLVDPWYAVADPEVILRHAAEVGIDRTVIFPIENTTYEKANEDIAQLCRRYPGRFVGFAKHNPLTEKGRLRSLLLREYHELGLRGQKLHQQPTPELLDVVKELGIPVLYHPRRVALYEEFLPSYPTINFIMAHLGSDTSGNWHEHLAAIDLAKRYPNVYLDTSTVVLTSYLEKAIQELPPERIVFGSDEPEVDCRMEIFKIRVLKLPKEKEDLILGGNMLRLLGGRI